MNTIDVPPATTIGWATTTTKGAPRISVVVPAYNEATIILRCLSALAGQRVKPLEIIVVDNMSTDATAELVRGFAATHPWSAIRLVTQDREQGITPTRNAGFDAARGDVIARIDADSIVPPEWTTRMIQSFRRSGAAGVTGPVAFHDLPAPWLTGLVDRSVRRLTLMASGGHTFLFGSNMAITREAWRAVREGTCPDHEDVMHEDVDLALHLESAGFELRYDARLRARISARRGTTDRADYLHYVGRLDTTYERHGVRGHGPRLPAHLMRATYPLVSAATRALRGTPVRLSDARPASAPAREYDRAA